MTIKEQYRREQQRIKRFIKSAEGRGYVFPEGIIPTTPKRITAASVRRLTQITPAFLYSKVIKEPAISRPTAPNRKQPTERKVRPPELPKPPHETDQEIAAGRRPARPEAEKIGRHGRKPYVAHPRVKKPEGYKSSIALRKAYTKELQRVKSLVKRAEKRGYIVPLNLTRQKPSTQLTFEDLAALRSLTPKAVYAQSMYIDPTTGEYTTGSEGRKLERQRQAKRAAETRAVRKLFTPISVGYFPSEEDVGYNNLMGLLRTAANGDVSTAFSLQVQYSRNATAMLNVIERIIDNIGYREILELFKTPEGEMLISTAYEAVYTSDDYRARQWAGQLEHLLYSHKLITDEELKEIQDEREEAWETVQ